MLPLKCLKFKIFRMTKVNDEDRFNIYLEEGEGSHPFVT